MMRAWFALLAVVVAGPAARASSPGAAPAYDAAFWKAWGDGRAEIDGYALTRMRYGEKRTGTVVAVFVTEPWSVRGHVKADEGKHDAGDVVQVLKLNLVEDFQTGIYDYNLMTSAWTTLTGPTQGPPSLLIGATPKISFSAQEWCGTTYSDVVFDGSSASEVVRSYFDGETGAHVLANPAAHGDAALVEDNVLVWARGLASPVVLPGASTEVQLLPALARARLLHTPLAWTTAKLSRESGVVDVDVPAGRLRCRRAHVEIVAAPREPARTIELCVEEAEPHRIVSLTASDGYALALTGTVRTPYWTQNHEGDEVILQQLGLHPPRSR